MEHGNTLSVLFGNQKKHHLENYKLQKEQNLYLVATSDRCRSAPRNEPFINPVAVLFSEAELENEKIGKAVSRKSSSRNTVYRFGSDSLNKGDLTRQ